jgi:hypothetical protein
MHLGGDWVDTERRRWEAGGWVPEEERGCTHFRQLRLRQAISMPLGFPAAHLSVRAPKLCFVQYRVRCRKAGRQAVNVSSCTNSKVCPTKANICREDKVVMLAPGPIFGRAFRQTLIGATLPNRNSVTLKSGIVPKQCPCISEKLKRSFEREKAY